MRTRRSLSLGLAATALLVTGGALATSFAQEAEPKVPVREQIVVVEDTEGKTHRLVRARIFAEAVGLLSISLQASDTFALRKGAAKIRVPVREIWTIEFSGGDKPGEWKTVTVTDHDKNSVTGTPEDPTKAEIRGDLAESRFAVAELKLNSVKKITFTHRASRPCKRCNRDFHETDWKFCPFDGDRLPKLDEK